ncbi:MAG TPA: L,D-transpeptidase family protein [Flavobacterium sp.]|nr:L,D-transpeptidase family protein [Flavobacterium sp.]
MQKAMFWIVAILIAGILVYYFYPEKKLPEGTVADRIEIFKSKREMRVYSNGALLKSYAVALGGNPIGHKQYEGDKKTPEGEYTINAKNPNSGYHKNLGVSYPNEIDLAFAQKMGKPAGGDIKIHGLRNGGGLAGKFHRWKDWTFGCIAVTNDEIDELFEAVPIGTPIAIYP